MFFKSFFSSQNLGGPTFEFGRFERIYIPSDTIDIDTKSDTIYITYKSMLFNTMCLPDTIRYRDSRPFMFGRGVGTWSLCRRGP